MTNDATHDVRLYLRQGALGTHWPNGARLDGITSRTATMIADHIVDEGPLTLLLVDRTELAVLTDAVRAYDRTHAGAITEILEGLLERLEQVTA